MAFGTFSLLGRVALLVGPDTLSPLGRGQGEGAR
jgi:hypothetical protein